MKVYFAGSIMGGRENLPIYMHIVEFLKALGHEVPSEHVARPRVLDEESILTPQQVYERDVAWIRISAAVIAEVSTPSLGVGYEIATALHLGLPVLCLHQAELSISKLISGNRSIKVSAYADLSELDRHIQEFLHRIRL
jgi:2'-deoxynucleoside 5'-phosphate N-hydrolase